MGIRMMKVLHIGWVTLITTAFALILLYFFLGRNIRINIKFIVPPPKDSVFDSIFKTPELKHPKPIMNIKKFQRSKHPSTQMPSTSTTMLTTTSTQNVVTSSAKLVTSTQKSVSTSHKLVTTSETSLNPVRTTKIPKLSKEAKIVTLLQISEENKTILLDLLRVFIGLADSLNLTYFIQGGTLLGSWRHHGMIPWDDDIDVFVNVTQKPQLLAAIKKLEPHYVGPDTKPVIKFYSKKSRPVHKRKWHWPFIDICFFKDNGKVLWDTIKYFSGIKYALNKIFPLHKRPFETFEVYAPRDPLYMIENAYTNTKAHCTTWTYRHATETGGHKSHSISCEKLKDVVPFVHRQYLNGTMEEELRLGPKVIHTKYVNEERSSLCKPYDLKRI